jgi:putative acetyltransferase
MPCLGPDQKSACRVSTAGYYAVAAIVKRSRAGRYGYFLELKDSEMSICISPARLPDDIDTVRQLFMEYIESLGIDLSFQDVDAELADLPGKYTSPAGMILVARNGAEQPVGCVALRPMPETDACEIKRLYVRPEARGQDLGRRLAQSIIAYATEAGYSRILLDTLASMQAAQQLYASLGFQSTAPYYDNPVPGTVYLALDL